MMKIRRLLAPLMVLLLFVLITSCAETPDKDIVVNKQDSALYVAESSENESEDDEAQTEEQSEIQKSFTNDSGTVTFQIDAQIHVPDTQEIPFIKTEICFYSPDDLARICNAVCGGSPIYEYSEALTQETIEEAVLRVKQSIADKDHLNEYYDGDENAIDQRLAQLQEQLQKLENYYETAEKEAEVPLSDFSYHEDSYYVGAASAVLGLVDGTGAIDGINSMKASTDVDGIPLFIWASQRNDNEYKLSSLYIYPHDALFTVSENDFLQTEKITEQEVLEARQLIDAVLSEAGMQDWTLYSEEISEYAVFFTYLPTYSGVQIAANQGAATLRSDLEYRDLYSFPKLEILVSDGRILDFMLKGELSVTDVIYENAPLMQRQKIIDRICEQLKLSWTTERIGQQFYRESNCTVSAATICVTEMELTLVRTLVKNEPDHYYLMPAWIVYGTYQMDEYSVGGMKASYPQEDTEREVIPLLCINAMDGSVIDMSQGY